MSAGSAQVLLREASAILAAHGIASPALDARLIMQHVLDMDHAAFVSRQYEAVRKDQATAFQTLLERRIEGEPVHRIIGVREFYGAAFAISPAVLDPRPETELLVERILSDYGGRRGLRFADLGTGSGAIAISLLQHLKESSCVAIDFSQEALTVAEDNAGRLGVRDRLELLLSDYLSQTDEQFDFLVSNPPYIRSSEIADLQREVRMHDPRPALDGGLDGLDAYRSILSEAIGKLKPLGKLYLECGIGQEKDIRVLAAKNDWRWVQSYRDLCGIERVIVLQSPQVDAARTDF